MKFKDRTVTTFKATGTNNGPLAEDMPPTGKKMSFNGVTISKIENGKIIETWVYYNQLPLYKQLGYKLVPAEEKPMKK
jgi:predicted ester cyclase